MAQASAAQQRQEVERALREADQGANFRSNFSHIFLFFQRNWFDVIFAKLTQINDKSKVRNDLTDSAYLPKKNEILEPGQKCAISGFGYMGYEREWNKLVEKLPETLQESNTRRRIFALTNFVK